MSRSLLAAAAAVAAAIAAPAAQAARTIPADVRVVTTAGKSLADVRQYTGSVRVRTDRGARCFFGGSGGSGDPFRIAGPTALGAVADAARLRASLRPLSLTDEYVDDGFGLGVCGVGGHRASGSAYWYSKVDHVGLQVSGSQARLKRGDRVLWYLTPSYPPPVELELKAPARARPGAPVHVRVFAFDDRGNAAAAAGATVYGSGSPATADSDGWATLTFGREGARTVLARREADIPSRSLRICIAEPIDDCSAVRGRSILGSKRRDRIRGTNGDDRITPGRGADRVRARRGDDRIKSRGGGRDRVACGGGKDLVKADRRDLVAANCERVVRR